MSQKGKEEELVQTDLIERQLEAEEVIEADDVQGVGAQLFMCQNPKCKTQVCPTECTKPLCACEPEKTKDGKLKNEAEDKEKGDVCKEKAEKGFRHCDKRC